MRFKASRIRASAVAAALSTLLGCGPPPALAGEGGRYVDPPSARIGREELATISARNVDDAIRRLRPEMLRIVPASRTITGAEAIAATVYVDGHYAGPLDVLVSIPVEPVIEIVYLKSAAARVQFGSRCACGGGVILVTTRPNREPRGR